MTGQLEQLFDEFVGRWARDEPLAVDELLVRAGPEAEELAVLIDRFLERAPRRTPSEEAVAFVRSLDDPPLLRARQALGLKLDDLAAALVEKLGLQEKARVKVRRLYQELELGQLEAAGVTESVWDALAGLLGRDVRGLAGRPLPAPAVAPMFREANFVDEDLPLAGRAAAEPPEPDEVDRLFGVG